MNGRINGKQITNDTVIKSINSVTYSQQGLTSSNDSNITLNITSSGATHSYNVGWNGILPLSRGGLNNSTFTASQILVINSSTSSVVSSGYIFNDLGISSNDIWSANKVINFLQGSNYWSLSTNTLSATSSATSVLISGSLAVGVTFSASSGIYTQTVYASNDGLPLNIHAKTDGSGGYIQLDDQSDSIYIQASENGSVSISVTDSPSVNRFVAAAGFNSYEIGQALGQNYASTTVNGNEIMRLEEGNTYIYDQSADGNISINTNNHTIAIQESDGINLRTFYNLYMGSDDLRFESDGTDFKFRDNGFNKGIQYVADYSATFVDESLITKRYLDNTLSGYYTFSNGLTQSASIVKLGGSLVNNTYLNWVCSI